MKKLVFSLMLVFATSSLVSANEIESHIYSCDEYAMDVFYEATESMSYLDAFDLSEDAYEACIWLNYLAPFL